MTSRRIAVIDGLVALTMAAGCLRALRVAYQADVLEDDGAPETLFIFGAIALYLAPNTLLFGLASLCMWRRWKVRQLVQALAIFWALFWIIAAIVAPDLTEHLLESLGAHLAGFLE
jgi:hypothetical protein